MKRGNWFKLTNSRQELQWLLVEFVVNTNCRYLGLNSGNCPCSENFFKPGNIHVRGAVDDLSTWLWLSTTHCINTLTNYVLQ